ncbi:MAG: amidohydrolase [Gemmatimonadetes bacterium]|nr:amidohydrolase [Gemmatimonadota bacterium]MBK7715914.1 amidohydrolase [Gemmatimonadota bacterium]MBK7925159.1 amidohydrolase [Gemmatimonadota bacterium]MBK9692328.1 amidohydrolase [Gemmatimonadota bacterium]
MLIDVHAHFFHERAGRADWQERNASRLAAGERIGIRWHVASILGSWGHTSPVYFPSPDDVTFANLRLRDLAAAHPARVRGYVVVNPNHTTHALAEIATGAGQGMIGVKLAASRRADDPLLDPVCQAAREHRLPVLHHVWQHRRREWPGQEASDGVELCRLAARHPEVWFLLAHIGGGGDWLHTLRAARGARNVLLDLSGSGVDGGMLDEALRAVGAERLVWGADVTLCTGWAKLRYLERRLPPADVALVCGGNAQRIFPPGAFA